MRYFRSYSKIDINLDLTEENIHVRRGLKKYANEEFEIITRFHCHASLANGEAEIECVDFVDIDTDKEIEIPVEVTNNFVDMLFDKYEDDVVQSAYQDALEQHNTAYEYYIDSKIDEARGK